MRQKPGCRLMRSRVSRQAEIPGKPFRLVRDLNFFSERQKNPKCVSQRFGFFFHQFFMRRRVIAAFSIPGGYARQRLLDALHIFCFSAAAISFSLKSGWAMEIRSSALSHVLRPARLTAPYSVTI